jgi:hypothetical protein
MTMPLFSERFEYTKASDVIIREKITPEIQNAICSCYDKLEQLYRLEGYDYPSCEVRNFEEYLWMMTPATGDLRQYISNKLAQTTFISQFLYNVSINYENNNYESIYHVLITLYNNDKSVQKEIQLGGKK